jgi:hypothetical protein
VNDGLSHRRLLVVLAFAIGCTPVTARTIVYDPGTVQSSTPEDRYAHGTLDLSVTLSRGNPFCASYQVKIGAQAYTPQSAIALAAAAPQGGAPIVVPAVQACSTLAGDKLGKCAIDSAAAFADALSDLQTTIQGWQGALAGVWLKCDAPTAALPATVTEQYAALHDLAGKLEDSGLDKMLSAATEASLVAFRASKQLRSEQAAIAADLVGAKTAAQQGKDALDAATKSKAKNVDALRQRYANAQKTSDDLQGKSDQLDKLASTTSDWADQITKLQGTLKPTLDSLRTDVEAGLSLASPAPTAGGGGQPVLLTRQQFEPNQLVTVEVVETRRAGGKPVDKGGDRSLGVANIAVLRPIWVDVGIGPSLTFQAIHNYGLGGNNQIVQTENSANVDGLVSLSAYLYGPRYLDGRAFNCMSLIPRPMMGLSMRQPFSSLYIGGQIDPIQFLDISAGARLYSATELLGPQLGAPAAVDSTGTSIAPATEAKARFGLFMSISASTDLFSSWLTSLATGA